MSWSLGKVGYHNCLGQYRRGLAEVSVNRGASLYINGQVSSTQTRRDVITIQLARSIQSDLQGVGPVELYLEISVVVGAGQSEAVVDLVVVAADGRDDVRVVRLQQVENTG